MIKIQKDQKMIFVVSSVRGYSDVTMFGPFSSLEDAKRSVTDGVVRGNDGDETQYTFFEYNSYVNRIGEDNIEEIGHVLLKDEYESHGEDLREAEVYPGKRREVAAEARITITEKLSEIDMEEDNY